MGNLDEDYGVTSFVVKYKTFGCVLTSSSLNLTTINFKKKSSYSTIIASSNTQDTLQEENGIEDGVATSSRKPE